MPHWDLFSATVLATFFSCNDITYYDKIDWNDYGAKIIVSVWLQIVVSLSSPDMIVDNRLHIALWVINYVNWIVPGAHLCTSYPLDRHSIWYLKILHVLFWIGLLQYNTQKPA